MMPRFARTLLFLSTLSLLILPAGDVQAQSSGEVTGTITAAAVASCTVGTTRLPDGSEIPVTVEHERCTGGSISLLSNAALEATRDAGPDMRTATCNATPPAGSVIPFTTRENTAAGRGRLGPSTFNIGTGTVVDPAGSASGPCTVRLTGTFHRVFGYVVGRLVRDIHVDTGSPARDFRHWYCARFVATAVPDPVITGVSLLSVVIEGRQPCRPERERDDADPFGDPPEPAGTHGRVPADNNVLEHDAFHH